MRYDVIVIGAGVAGLFAALSLSRRQKKVLLLERQAVPGGYATTFKRKGFTFESALHCVDALAEGGEIREFLKETGIDKRLDFIELKNFCRIIYPEHNFTADFNCDNFIKYLKSNFPQEKENIDKLFKEIDKFYTQFDRFCDSRFPQWLKFILIPLIYPSLLKISELTAAQFVGRYIKDEKLTAIITDIWRFSGLPPSRLSALYFLLTFQGYFYSPTAYIKGGFIRLFEAMVEAIRENGSEVRFNTTVGKIITDKNRVEAVVTDKGEEIKTKAVISNVNAIDTLSKLVDNEGVRRNYLSKLASLEKSVSAFQVYLGLDVPARSLGMSEGIFSINTTYDHDKNSDYSRAGNYEQCPLEIVDHAEIDPSLVPQGKGSLLIMTFDNYANWRNLSEEEYRARKQEAAQILIRRAEKFLPGLSGHIEVMEIATPQTMRRFTLSADGAIYGFSQTVKQSGVFRLPQTTSVKGLILAGAWTRPGHGVHGCFISGLDAAELI